MCSQGNTMRSYIYAFPPLKIYFWGDFLSVPAILEGENGENEREIILKLIMDKKFSEVLTVMNPKVREMLINFGFVESGIYVKSKLL